jgi:hypothetical protein
MAFKFVGDKAVVCKYFKETYSPPNIFHNWEFKDSPSAKNGPS